MYSILVLGGVMVSQTSFGWKVKLLAPFRKISRHVKDPLRYVRDTDRRNHLSPYFLLRVSAATREDNYGG
jgi:hypothetical protein